MKTQPSSDPLKGVPMSDAEFNKLLLAHLDNELRTFRLYPSLIDLKIRELKLPEEIINKISLMIDRTLEQIDQLIDKHHNLTSKYHKSLFRYFINWSIRDIINDEYMMIKSVIKYASMKDTIEGKYLKFNIQSSEIELIEQTTSWLIDGYNQTLKLFLSLYNEHNSKWLQEFMTLNRKIDKIETEKIERELLNEIEPYFAQAIKYKKTRVSMGKRPSLRNFALYLDVKETTLKERLSRAGQLNRIKELFNKNIIE